MTEAMFDRRGPRADLLGAVEALRATGALDGSRPVWVALPGPTVEPRQLLDLLGDAAAPAEPDAVVWENAEESFAGWGVASSIQVAGGPDRFDRVRREVESFELGAFVVGDDHVVSKPETGPRWLGGFAFEDEPIDEGSPWAGFGAACFVLPRLTVRAAGGTTQWALVLEKDQAADASQSEGVNLLSWLWDRIESGVVEGRPVVRAMEARTTSPTAPGPFADRIRDAVASIRDHELEKVVAATHVDVALETSPALDQLLATWSEGALESTRFLFRRNGTAFLGATPERLVRKTGRLVESGALAGTAPKEAAGSRTEAHSSSDSSGGGRRAAARLLASAKNRSEHDFVVRHLTDRLEPLCSSLHVSDQLSILELRDLLHLQTPIDGELREERHVLELVAALHPTPAVCGYPTEAARQWIHDNEQVRRGWYSGPVGWVDADGNGDFQVALRSMLLTAGDPGDSNGTGSGFQRARLYAGVGLVRDSQVQEELHEIDAKLLTAGRALRPWIRHVEPAPTAAEASTHERRTG